MFLHSTMVRTVKWPAVYAASILSDRIDVASCPICGPGSAAKSR